MEQQPLAFADAQNIQTALLKLIKSFAGYPKGFTANEKTVKWNAIGENTSIAVIPLQGAIYLKKYVNGAYTAQMPLQIVYRSSPTTSAAAIAAQTMLEELAKYLEQSYLAVSDEHIQFEGIVRTSPVFTISIKEKETECGVNLQLKYFYRK